MELFYQWKHLSALLLLEKIFILGFMEIFKTYPHKKSLKLVSIKYQKSPKLIVTIIQKSKK